MVLIGQIKLTRIHVLSLFLPGVRVKRDKEASLYDVERSGRGAFAGTTQPNLLFSRDVYSVFAVVSPGNGGARRDRTDDILLAKQALSQLSYGPITETKPASEELVGPGRLELPTSRLSGVRSNHLSYGPSGSRQRAGNYSRRTPGRSLPLTREIRRM